MALGHVLCSPITGWGVRHTHCRRDEVKHGANLSSGWSWREKEALWEIGTETDCSRGSHCGLGSDIYFGGTLQFFWPEKEQDDDNRGALASLPCLAGVLKNLRRNRVVTHPASRSVGCTWNPFVCWQPLSHVRAVTRSSPPWLAVFTESGLDVVVCGGAWLSRS